VEKAAVLDRPHGGADGVVQALAAVGARRHRSSPPPRISHRGLDLLASEVGRERIIVVGEETARGRQLDPVGAGAQDRRTARRTASAPSARKGGLPG
jgi:hypothetical protein